jgi:hypothetical protein
VWDRRPSLLDGITHALAFQLRIADPFPLRFSVDGTPFVLRAPNWWRESLLNGTLTLAETATEEPVYERNEAHIKGFVGSLQRAELALLTAALSHAHVIGSWTTFPRAVGLPPILHEDWQLPPLYTVVDSPPRQQQLPSLYTVLSPSEGGGAAMLSRGVHPELRVARTLLEHGGRRLEFGGLFTTASLPKYTFLGLYTGECLDSDDEDAAASVYAVAPPTGGIMVPRVDSDGRVDPNLYPMSMVNEPPGGTVANATLLDWRDEGLALHATRDISAGEEIYWHYGNLYSRRHYPRNMTVGTPSTVKNRDIPLDQHPRRFLEARGVPLPEDTCS